MSTGWFAPVPDDHPAAALLTAAAVRRGCTAVAEAVQAGHSPHWTWQADALDGVADFVADTVRQRHPDLAVPVHSRWRHFEAGGVDRWGTTATARGWPTQPRTAAGPDPVRLADPTVQACARARIDLVIPSVLLDAGAGPHWAHDDPATGQRHARSEGLGVASLRLFEAGVLSDDPADPLRADATALARLTPAVLAAHFQVGPHNPLVGLEGRAALLARLGEVMAATPAAFGQPARLGHLLDHWRGQHPDGVLPAADVLATLLRALGPVWPGRIARGGVSLGDAWPHPAAPDGVVVFHKLTQWLAYSLLEPLQDAGFAVTGLDALTGLPEYRNGGLLIDLGLLVPRDPAFLTTPQPVDAPAVVEWRALTVVALDRLADAVRQRLGLDAAQFPLARVLEGGTWAAGRRIAAQRRPGGGPPVQILSDGTVF